MATKKEEIVIGSSLSALIFAYNNELPIYFSEPKEPRLIDYMNPDDNVDLFGIENTTQTMRSFGEEKIIGVRKSILWGRLLFILALDGKAPVSNLCKSMRYNGQTLVFNDEYSKIGEIEFEKCYYFGDENAHQLVRVKKEPTQYACYDWVRFRVGGKHDCDFIYTEDDFVNEIHYYYPVGKLGRNHTKDACAISILKPEHITDFDYSETMARFKIIHEMKSRGMRARVSEYKPNGEPKKYKAYKLEYQKREIEALDTVLEPLENKIVLMPNTQKINALRTDGRLSNLARKIL
jgi:hypothetical protein